MDIALVVLALTLSLDNFRSAIAIGTVPFRFARALQIALVFGIWDAVAPLLGGILGRYLGDALEPVADYIGPAILGLYGLYLLFGALRKPAPEELDHPWVTLFGMPLSLSVDNLLAGTGLGVVGVSPFVIAPLFGAVTVVMTLAGLCIGRLASRVIRIRADLLSGISLIGAAILIPVLSA